MSKWLFASQHLATIGFIVYELPTAEGLAQLAPEKSLAGIHGA